MTRPEEITLEAFQVYASNRLSPAVIQRMSVDRMVDIVTGDLVYSIKGYVLADQLAPKAHTVYMDVHRSEWESWWQHTKAAHFPTLSRWLRREPRERTSTQTFQRTIDVRNYVTFPEYARVLGPEFGRHFRVQVLTDNGPWTEATAL